MPIFGTLNGEVGLCGSPLGLFQECGLLAIDTSDI